MPFDVTSIVLSSIPGNSKSVVLLLSKYVEHFGRFQLKPKLTKFALKQMISQDFLFNAILKNFPSSAFPVEGKIGSLEFFSKLEIQQAEVGNE